MLASTVLVTVCGSLKTLDLELPGDVPVSELIPLLLKICGSGEDTTQAFRQADARLRVAGMAGTLSSDKTLVDAGICDGTVLVLQASGSPSLLDESLAPQQFMPRSVQPDVNTGGVGVTWVALQ